MKEELERYKKALEVAEWWIDSCCELGQRKNAHREIDTALNPPPVYETVEEIVGWVNVYQNEKGKLRIGGTYDSEHEANSCSVPEYKENRISCQPIKVTVQRPVKVKETKRAKLNLYDDGSYTLYLDGEAISRVSNDLDGIDGIFEYEE